MTPNPKRLRKLIAYRSRLEKQAQAELADAMHLVEEIQKERGAILEHRSQAESTIYGLSAATAEEIKARHDHLAKIGQDLETVADRLEKAEDLAEEKRNAVMEAQREVKLLELVEEREKRRALARDKRYEQMMSDEYAARSHYAGGESEPDGPETHS